MTGPAGGPEESGTERTAAEQQGLHFAFLPVTLSGPTLEFAWGYTCGVCQSLEVTPERDVLIPLLITFFFFPNAPNYKIV